MLQSKGKSYSSNQVIRVSFSFAGSRQIVDMSFVLQEYNAITIGKRRYIAKFSTY